MAPSPSSDTNTILPHVATDDYVPGNSKETEIHAWQYGLPGTLIAVFVLGTLCIGSTVFLFIWFLVGNFSE